jgi:hypothetical protein
VEDVVHRAGDFNETGDVLLHKLEAGMSEQVADVGLNAGDEIVETQNFPAAFDEAVAEVRAEKAGATGDDSAQEKPFVKQESLRVRDPQHTKSYCSPEKTEGKAGERPN